jgi:hypothetical protein
VPNGSAQAYRGIGEIRRQQFDFHLVADPQLDFGVYRYSAFVYLGAMTWHLH